MRSYPHPPSLGGWVPPLPHCAGLSGEKSSGGQGKEFACQFRLGRACPGHPRLETVETKTWIRGSSPRKTTLTHFLGVSHKLALQGYFPRTALPSLGAERVGVSDCLICRAGARSRRASRALALRRTRSLRARATRMTFLGLRPGSIGDGSRRNGDRSGGPPRRGSRRRPRGGPPE